MAALQGHLTPAYGYLRPETFKIEFIPGGAVLHVTVGIFRVWISTTELLAMAHGLASDRGGRIEIEGSPFFRSVARTILEDMGSVWIERVTEHRDAYLTARPGSAHE